tara:strand:+ start:4495 stop:5112 length:618 start_codon:yes stop_codon:yes gene_type:complete
MAMQLNFSNMLQFFSAISPILLAFCLVLISLFNSDIKGMVYLGGILIASLINLFILNTLKIKSQALIPPFCNLVEFPFNLNEYISPAFNSMFIAFTLAYLYMPMKNISGINYPVLMFVLGLLLLDGATKIFGGCTTISGVLLGSLVGFLLGIGWFALFYNTDHKDLLFFGVEASNNVVCSRPKQQTFKCSLYKNGTIIGATSANA